MDEPEKETSESSEFAYMADETAVSKWQAAFPAAYRLYWILRAAMEEQDGRCNKRQHDAAVFAVHESFPGKPERARLGLPPTTEELADLLGISSRHLRNHRQRYAEIFETTRQTLRESFLSSYYGAVYEALGQTAATVGREGAADRRLFVQLTGDLVERADLTSDGERIEAPVIYMPANGRDGGAAGGDDGSD